MPLLGSIMTIAVDSATATSTSVLEENMTWSRPNGGTTFSSYEALTTRATIPDGEQLRRQTATASSDREEGRHLIGDGTDGPAKDERDARNNEKHIESDVRGIATGEEGEIAAEVSSTAETTTARKKISHRGCGQTSETRVCGRNTVGATKSGETAFTGDENVAGIGTGGGSEESVDGVGSTTVSVAVSISNSTEEDDGVAIEYSKDLLLFGISDMMEDIGPFNDSFNASLRYPWNNSLYNETFIVLGEGMYPSGYTLPEIVLASIVATLLMVVIIVGNMLVIIAIATEKALKNIQNWFIASLAVADFFLGLIIMPFSLANEIMGYWIFGYWWCDIYSAMDVLLCTASIMNLCLISLDRFWSITQAVDYLKKRTPARAALMIALVWMLSALVCIPPLLGWKRPTPAEEYPKCKLSEDIGYVIYSALGSFYIPSCIMVFVYIRIYFAAKARARRGIRKQPRPRAAVPPESPDVRQTSFTQSTPATDAKKPPGSVMENVATIENQPVQIPIVTCDLASDVSTSEADPGGGISIPMEEKDTLKVDVAIEADVEDPTTQVPRCESAGMSDASLRVEDASAPFSVSAPMQTQKSSLKATLSVNGDGQSSVPSRCRAPSVGIDVDMVSEFDPSSSDSGVVSRCGVVKPLKLGLCQPIFGRKHIGKKREHGDVSRHHGKDDHSGDARAAKPRDPEREKRRLARKKEKRATLILGFIMGSFIACWLPFFVLYIVKPMFPDFEIPPQAFVIAFWLGYTNSALNPFIYTVFNKDFRRAFRRILYK